MECCGATILQKNNIDKPLQYLRHVEYLLAQDPTNGSLIDVISNLKRAADHRVKTLGVIYKAKTLSKKLDAKGNYDVLVKVGVIKPLMLGVLKEIRNSIEHQYSDAPSVKRCKELYELVWYFLKSTNRLVQKINHPMSFKEEWDSGNFLEFVTSP